MFRCGSSRSNSNNSSYSNNTGNGGGTSAFTILFGMPNTNTTNTMEEDTVNDPYTYYSSSSSSCSSPVDCTLSLGTASTRQSSINKFSPKRNDAGGSSSCMPTIYWDILSQAKQPPASSRAINGHTRDIGGDSLLARRCANCDTTSTPLWRNGPRGPKSLCNACGIRYKKEERRAAATAMPSYSSSSTAPVSTTMSESQHRSSMGYGYNHDHPWSYTRRSTTTQSIYMSSSSGRWSNDNDCEETAIPYYSWLNVPPPRAEFLHH